MRKFRFPLQAALDWRLHRLELERARMAALQAERDQLEEGIQAIARTLIESQESIARATVLHAADLALAERYREAARAGTQRLKTRMKQLEQAIVTQGQRVAEASREHRLLEKLRERQYRKWCKEMERRLEEEAGERYLALWKPPEAG